MAEHMLTTVDNPYHPVDEFDEWNAYDMQLGYHTLSLLARIAIISDELPEPDHIQAIELAIKEICDENISGMHRMIEI